ncbi:MAG: winged helix-turn-helix domain-containing protein [Gemmatimonadetes bacterium]|nr:winged helix-turn-helix domain-containing protein [Gemmatimonadota bacterium]
MILHVIMLPMMLHGIILDRESRISLRRQLAGHLESRILGGQIGPGRRLPSIRRAEELLGLHRNTVAAAYRDLAQAGLARTRPGSGVFVRVPDRPDTGAALATVQGYRDVGLACDDEGLRAVLEAELRARLAVRVHRSGDTGRQIGIRLAPGIGFLKAIRTLPRPSIVAVCSGSDRVHRLASIALLIHGGEGVAYLPLSPGNRDSTHRACRLATLVAADYAALAWARDRLPVEVAPLPLISAYSWSELALHLRRHGPGSRPCNRARRRVERSLQTSVEEP